MMKYHEQIKHPLWQKKRLEVLEANRFTCKECGATESELHIHHPFYKRGAMIWDYELYELHCLCSKCHKDAHSLDEIIRLGLSGLAYSNKLRVLGYIDSIQMPPRGKLLDNDDYRNGYIDMYINYRDSIANDLKRGVVL